MKKNRIKLILLWISLFIGVTACQPTGMESGSDPVKTENEKVQTQIDQTITSTIQELTEEDVGGEKPGTATPEVDFEDIGNINPLTGLEVPKENLERRPILVKVENLPRNNRPQWGLSYADHVYEYHTEEGTTRFAAIFYGQQAEKIGPIRSGRMFDARLVNMYKSVFVFGSAYRTVLEYYAGQPFSQRLIVEGPYTYPALFRYEPAGKNVLLANTYDLSLVYELYEMDNLTQDLSGMVFSEDIPDGGEEAKEIFVRFSSAIYNRWDYDPDIDSYLRFSDVENDLTNTNEVYEQLYDRLSGEAVSAQNLVILFAENYIVAPNIYDIFLEGIGDAYIIRNGRIYSGHWMRPDMEDMIVLTDQDGEPFPMKPGQTWFEVLSTPPQENHLGSSWRFTFQLPLPKE
ncbi:MAG: DUF3048 domain-containing protein [Anaerolineaceae bacterium]|nr:DUF3048 domain-containing protein [Anaerolineaceae bacterium]